MPFDEEDREGAWIFLSHSHRDLQEVRKIRNELERRGHNPLMFFLKCLEDDDSQLPELLRKEIGARNWFILCDSPNARASKWVRDEVAMIKGLQGKVFETVDLSRDLRTQLHKLVALTKRATVFLSYCRGDREKAAEIATVFRENDYRVFTPDDSLVPAESWLRQIAEAIDRAMREGFFIPLLSSGTTESHAVLREVMYAFEKLTDMGDKSNIVPVFLEPKNAVAASMPDQMSFALGGIQGFDMSTGNLRDRCGELIRELKTREMG